jgi:threonine/homoserine/homoserine lactone efflux protein
MLYAIFGARINILFKEHYFKKLFNRVTGSILIGSGLALVFSKK